MGVGGGGTGGKVAAHGGGNGTGSRVTGGRRHDRDQTCTAMAARWWARADTRSSTLTTEPPAVRDDALVVHDVKLLGVHVSDITDKDFRADFDLDLALHGQYRLVDSDHKPLSDWSEVGPSSGPRFRLRRSTHARMTNTIRLWSAKWTAKASLSSFPLHSSSKNNDGWQQSRPKSIDNR